MSRAADTARAEHEQWSFASTVVDLLASGWDGPEPREHAVTGFDPAEDLARRTAAWSHPIVDPSLAGVLAFGAALALSEAEAWERHDRSVAAQALSDRRTLLGDRIIHWAVPWLVTVGSTTSEWAPEAMAAAEALLGLGDTHRVAPALTGGEGLAPPGHDSFGPLPGGLATRDLGGGWLFHDYTTQVGAEPYEAAAALWDQLARRHPGSARLWADLAVRATASAARLRAVDDR